jgi:hypothetical protein
MKLPTKTNKSAAEIVPFPILSDACRRPHINQATASSVSQRFQLRFPGATAIEYSANPERTARRFTSPKDIPRG